MCNAYEVENNKSDNYVSLYIRAYKRFKDKMSMKKYQQYIANSAAQRILFQDCLVEEGAEDRYNIKSSEVKDK